ncbi:hypothetical protein [Roseovarius sp.]|uniref:hypothetical protein n=1 Tax=Roseovarius sp. TaxID=1486281 RepID=UPI003A980EFF
MHQTPAFETGLRAYPCYNISARLTRPSVQRLLNIGEAGKHSHYRDRYQDCYALDEAED